MKKLSYIAGAFALILCLSSFTNGVELAKDKKEKAKTEKVKKEGKKKKESKATTSAVQDAGKLTDIWAFGFSISFKDSAVYMTDLQEIRQVRVQPKTQFLEHRDEYSSQLKLHLEDVMGLRDRTCAVLYETSKKNAEKKYQQVRNRYLQETHLNLHILNSTEFLFKKMEDE